MKAYLKGTNIGLIIKHFYEVKAGNAKCQMCDCVVPKYNYSTECILADLIELR